MTVKDLLYRTDSIALPEIIASNVALFTVLLFSFSRASIAYLPV